MITITVVAMVAGYNVYMSESDTNMSDLVLRCNIVVTILLLIILDIQIDDITVQT